MRVTDCLLQIQYMSAFARHMYEENGGLHYATADAAGMDLRACLPDAAEFVTIDAGERLLVPSGIAIQPCSQGVAGFVYSRSGLGAKQGVVVAQGVGVIDADYRGEIMVMLLNTATQPRQLRCGERMAQLVLQPVVRAAVSVVERLDQTARGAGGFGHTGNI